MDQNLFQSEQMDASMFQQEDSQKGLAFMGPRKLNKEEKSEESLMSSSLLPFFL